MAYSDFTLEAAVAAFELDVATGSLFPEISPASVPTWLTDQLDLGSPFALRSEKARSEFIIAPILLAICRLYHFQVSLYSGQRFDVEPEYGLSGECDFILSASEPVPIVRAPILSVIEAKKADLELGYGQCVAQMVAAYRFNRQRENTAPTVYGCVTTGDSWQFLRLADSRLTFDETVHYLPDLAHILAIFFHIVAEVAPQAALTREEAVAS